MIVPDVNVMVAAFRRDHDHHAPARAALEDARHAGSPVAVLDLVRVGFARIVSSRRIFVNPDTVADALAFADALAAAPVGMLDTPSAGRWTRVADVCARAGAQGELLVDAYIAAAAIELGATVVSFDTDFARFDDVRWVKPT